MPASDPKDPLLEAARESWRCDNSPRCNPFANDNDVCDDCKPIRGSVEFARAEVAKAVAAEREACASTAEQGCMGSCAPREEPCTYCYAAVDIAAAIRARREGGKNGK